MRILWKPSATLGGRSWEEKALSTLRERQEGVREVPFGSRPPLFWLYLPKRLLRRMDRLVLHPSLEPSRTLLHSSLKENSIHLDFYLVPFLPCSIGCSSSPDLLTLLPL